MAIFSLIYVDTDDITKLTVTSQTTGYFYVTFASAGLVFSIQVLATPVIGLREADPVRPSEHQPTSKPAVVGITDINAEIVNCYPRGWVHRRSTLCLASETAVKWNRLISDLIEPHIPEIVAGWKVPEKDVP